MCTIGALFFRTERMRARERDGITEISNTSILLNASLRIASTQTWLNIETCLPNFKNNTHADIHANKAINKFCKQTQQTAVTTVETSSNSSRSRSRNSINSTYTPKSHLSLSFSTQSHSLVADNIEFCHNYCKRDMHDELEHSVLL